MRTVLVALLSVGWIGGAAWAQGSAPTLSGQTAPNAQTEAPLTTPVKATKKAKKQKMRRRVTETRADIKKTAHNDEDTLTSCLAIWEPATHMTPREWARACARLTQRLKEMT